MATGSSASAITLERLFRFQDDAAIHNREHSEQLVQFLNFVRSSVEIASHALVAMRFGTTKQHAIRVLGADALTGIVCSVRVGLWGDLPESVCLLRSSLETTTILHAAVHESGYDALAAEIAAAKLAVYSYERARKRLGALASRIAYLWGTLSDLGSHSTGSRLRFASYTVDGEPFDRLAAALDPTTAELALRMAPDVLLCLLETLETAYLQDGLEFADPVGLMKMRALFQEIKNTASEGTA